MSDHTVTRTGGIGFVGVLTIVFITLKLTNAITWSWWWVLSPLWISFGVWLLLVLIFIFIAALVVAADNDKRR